MDFKSILADFKDYDGIHAFAVKALSRVPKSIKTHYWRIYTVHAKKVLIIHTNFKIFLLHFY